MYLGSPCNSSKSGSSNKAAPGQRLCCGVARRCDPLLNADPEIYSLQYMQHTTRCQSASVLTSQGDSLPSLLNKHGVLLQNGQGVRLRHPSHSQIRTENKKDSSTAGLCHLLLHQDEGTPKKGALCFVSSPFTVLFPDPLPTVENYWLFSENYH